MTSPKGDELTPSSFLTTTTVDKDGNFGSDTFDITQVSDELLMQYVAQGNERAAAELIARMDKFEQESGTAPEAAPEEAVPEPEAVPEEPEKPEEESP